MVYVSEGNSVTREMLKKSWVKGLSRRTVEVENGDPGPIEFHLESLGFD